MQFNPHVYQQHAIEHLEQFPKSGLLLTMGLGKSVIILTHICNLKAKGSKDKWLIIGPKKVAESTWSGEVEKWDHTKNLRISKILGSAKQRKEALAADADIYVINRENVAWLVAQLGSAFAKRFPHVVCDESSSFKNPTSSRFKALRMVCASLKSCIILTGTPIPNGLLDLWPQVYLLDQGERLGKSMAQYRDEYFKPGKKNGFIVYEYNLKGQKEDGFMGAGIYEKEIYEKIGDICISMKTEDWLDLPPRIDRVVKVALSDEERKKYIQFERDQVLKLTEEQDITALNAAGLCNKLLQYANGAVYDENREWHEVQTSKLDQLAEIYAAANGKPVLVFYQFKHDIARIKAKLGATELKDATTLKRWNDREIPLLCAHAKSAGHGLNMQAGGNIIVWFGMPWSLEEYEQANARLDRQGQTESVIVHHLVTEGSMDEDVMDALARKKITQDGMMDAVKARIAKYGALIS